MASHVVVISTDFRRASIKVNPGTFLIDVLEEACKKLQLSSDRYLLKHKQKQLDLTIPFRTSGLSPGAKLELVVKSSSPTVVTVALKLLEPMAALALPNGRLVDKFRSDTTLWKLLRAFESKDLAGGRQVNITGRGVPQTSNGVQSGSGQLYYESPALIIMGRELSSVSDLQKTLSQVGINEGSSLLQLTFKKTDKTLQEAMQEIGQFFEEMEAAEPKKESKALEVSATAEEKSSAVAEPGAETPVAPAAHTSAPIGKNDEAAQTKPAAPGASTVAMDVDSTAVPSPSGPVIYSAPTSSTPAAVFAVEDESVYHPTIAHAQLHQERLKAASQNKRLLSNQELEAHAAARRARLNAVRRVKIRVRFPDGMSADWEFGPDATGANLFAEVRSVMAHPDQPFRLGLPTGRRHIEDSDQAGHRLIHGYELGGGVIVNLIWADAVPDQVLKQPFLKDQVRNQAREIPVPTVPQGEEEEDRRNHKATQPSKPEKSEDGGAEGGGGKKIPKWLKLGKK